MTRITLFLAFVIATLNAAGQQVGVKDSIPKIYGYVEEMPRFKGNVNEFLSDNIRFPEAARSQGITGKVIIGFIIDTAGAVDSVKVMESVHPALDSEAVRVVKSMPNWRPGRQCNKHANVYYSIPIQFSFFDATEEPELVDSQKVRRQQFLQDSLANNHSAEYPGSWDGFIRFHLKYPKEAKRAGIEGAVRVRFLVESTGDVTDVQVEESVHPALDREALRVAQKMANLKWKPGKINGKPARYYMVLPFCFMRR